MSSSITSLDAISTPTASSVSIVESNEPPASLVGALDAMQHGVVPAVPMEMPIPPPEAPGTSLQPTKKGKGVGKRLTDRQRVEILDLMEKSNGTISNAEIARRYGITRAAIQKLKQKGDEVRARYRYASAESRDGRKRGGHILSVPFERELFEWVRGLKARKVPVPPSLVKEKAKLLVPKYGLGNFQASNGWYYNFCKRFSMSTGVLVDEKAAVEDVDTSLDPDQAQLQQMTINALEQQTFEQMQQYQHQMATSLQEQQEQMQQVHETQQQQVHEQQIQLQQRDATQTHQSKSDRMLELLEQQNALLERQNNMIEDQAQTIKRLFEVVTKASATI